MLLFLMLLFLMIEVVINDCWSVVAWVIKC
jgi:hypothetical protein